MMKNTFISIQEESGFDIQHLITLATFYYLFQGFLCRASHDKGLLVYWNDGLER